MGSPRAQMEILGLAIIVVLIMMGVLFAIVFVLRAPASNTLGQFKESELAANLVTTMLGTTTPCHDATVSQLLGDCAVFARLDCGSIGNSCDAASDAFRQMLAGSLETWHRSYRFNITGAYNVQGISYSSGACSGNIEGKTSYVPTAGGTLSVTLQLCS
jgi:hypothetical protein